MWLNIEKFHKFEKFWTTTCKQSNVKRIRSNFFAKRAVEYDSEKDWVSALEFYKNGTQALMEAIRTGNFLREKEQKSHPNSGVLQFAKNWVC